MTETSVLTDGLTFGEAPRWHEGRLWLSDFFTHSVKSVSLAGDLRVELEIDDQPSGLGWLPDGSLLVVSMSRRQVMRRDTDGSASVHANLAGYSDFHFNDMVVDPLGRAYVGNFGFDLETEVGARGMDSVIAEHETATLVRIDPDGSTCIAAEELHFPNGMVITPDGRTLIVAETLIGALTAFDVAQDGSLYNRRLWASVLPRVPDGIALDAAGNIWIANPLAAECVRVGEGGELLHTIDTEDPCYACMLGGDDGRTLFMLTLPANPPNGNPQKAAGKVRIARVDIPGAECP